MTLKARIKVLGFLSLMVACPWSRAHFDLASCRTSLETRPLGQWSDYTTSTMRFAIAQSTRVFSEHVRSMVETLPIEAWLKELQGADLDLAILDLKWVIHALMVHDQPVPPELLEWLTSAADRAGRSQELTFDEIARVNPVQDPRLFLAVNGNSNFTDYHYPLRVDQQGLVSYPPTRNQTESFYYRVLSLVERHFELATAHAQRSLQLFQSGYVNQGIETLKNASGEILGAARCIQSVQNMREDIFFYYLDPYLRLIRGQQSDSQRTELFPSNLSPQTAVLEAILRSTEPHSLCTVSARLGKPAVLEQQIQGLSEAIRQWERHRGMSFEVLARRLVVRPTEQEVSRTEVARLLREHLR